MKFKNILNLLKHQSGSVMIEFALILPLLLLILGSTVEISNVIYASQKNQTATVITSASFANLDTLDTASINDIIKLGRNVVGNFAQSTADYEVGVIVIQREWIKSFKLFKVVSGTNALLQFGFRNIRNSAQVSTGGAVDNPFVNLNELTASETALINNYAFNLGEQIIVAKSCLRYKMKIFTAISDMLFGVGDRILCNQTAPTTPRVVKFKFLPNGSVVPWYN